MNSVGWTNSFGSFGASGGPQEGEIPIEEFRQSLCGGVESGTLNAVNDELALVANPLYVHNSIITLDGAVTRGTAPGVQSPTTAVTITGVFTVDSFPDFQSIWAWGNTDHRLGIDTSGNLMLNNWTNTNIAISTGSEYEVSVDYTAAGVAFEMRIDGSTVWTGSAPDGSIDYVNRLVIGARMSSPTGHFNFFNGRISYLRVGDTALYRLAEDSCARTVFSAIAPELNNTMFLTSANLCDDWDFVDDTEADNIRYGFNIVESGLATTFNVFAGQTITIPTLTGYTYSGVMDWGDGSAPQPVAAWDDAGFTHTFEFAGEYQVRYDGVLGAWSFETAGDKDFITTVTSLGYLSTVFLRGGFRECTNLRSFDTSYAAIGTIADFSDVLRDCPNLETVRFNGAMQSVATITRICLGCTSLTSFEMEFATGNTVLTNTVSAFEDTLALQSIDISNILTSASINASRMFVNSGVTEIDVSGSVITNLSFATDFLLGSQLTTENYSDMLIRFASQTVKPGVPFHGGFSQYNAAGATARAILTGAPNNWVITDGGPA